MTIIMTKNNDQNNDQKIMTKIMMTKNNDQNNDK